MPPRDGGLRHAYLPSLLDRLQDDAPQQRSEPPEAYAPDERGMRRIIQRDLGLLLNTTNLNEELDAGPIPRWLTRSSTTAFHRSPADSPRK